MKLTLEQKQRIIENAREMQDREELAYDRIVHIITCLKKYISIERGTYQEPKRKMTTADYLSELNDNEIFDYKKYLSNKQ